MEPFAGHSGGIRAVAVTADGERIITGGEDSTVRVWDLFSGEQRAVFREHDGPVRAVGVSGDVLITCDEDATVWTWDLARKNGQKTSLQHRWTVSAAAIAPGVSTVATGSANGEVSRCDLATEAHERMPSERAWVRSLAVTADATTVVAGVKDEGVHVWKLGTPGVRRLGAGTVQAVAVNGTHVLAGDVGGAVELWDRATGAVPVEFTGHASGVSAVEFSPDGEFVIAGGDDGAILVWDRNRPGKPTVLNGHAGRVRALAAVPGSEYFVSSGDDGTIRVWDHRAGSQIAGSGFTAPAPPQPRAPVASDEESVRDLLGFRQDVRTLATVIADRSTEPPLCVALLGPWGSGKSSFMRQLQGRVDKLADLSRNNPERSVFAATVRQIRFNAWHYHDDQLWVGLIEHLFRSLAAEDSGDVPAAREELRARLRDIEARRDGVSRPPLLRTFRLLASASDPAERRRRRIALVVKSVLALFGIAVAVVGWIHLHQVIISVLGALVAVTAAVTPLVTFAQSVSPPFVAVSNLLRGKAEQRREELDREVRETRERLDQLDAAHRLATLIEEARSERYERYRGLLGRVHEDLRRLNDDMRGARAEWQRTGLHGPAPLERIVLYIDDLDRCSPSKVVDVLAAVHLLLALPMFVVVVAVDPRWLHRCLREADLSPEYLDKIFQLVYSLRPMGHRTSTLIDALLPQAIAGPGPAEPRAEALPFHPPDVPDDLPEIPDEAETESPVVQDLRPDHLLLREDERQFIHQLGPMLVTPRAVKKLINLYRLVRIGIRDDEFGEFPYRTVLVLLGMLVADPGRARETFESITGTTALSEAIPPEWRNFATGNPSETGELASYQRWVGTIARFSFETHHLTTP